MKIETDNLDAILNKYRGISNNIDDVVADTIEDIIIDTHSTAIAGIMKGNKTGITYQRYSPRRTHTASAAGEYPASDLGQLAAGVKMAFADGGMTGFVGTNVRHGVHLEFGTINMEARPWLLPSFRKATKDTVKKLKANFQRLK